MAFENFRYIGTDRNGRTQSGVAVPYRLTEFVEMRFNQGWRDLRMIDKTGEDVGGIARENDRRRSRIWWAQDIVNSEAT